MRWCPSPNFGPRRDGLTPDTIVLHYTAMASFEAALARLCDPVAEVSAHFLISRRGDTVQMVEETQRAWHAGAGEWRGCSDVNSRSIGIELDNDGSHPFPEPQLSALEDLVRQLRARWPVDPGDVIGHSDMAPDRKFDPGPRFDWTRLARRGLARPAGTAAPPASVTAGCFRERARQAGFTAPCSDDGLLRAVRARFRPAGQGPLAGADIAALPGSD